MKTDEHQPGSGLNLRAASLQYSTDTNLHFSVKPLRSSLCGFEPLDPAACCGGSQAGAGKGKGQPPHLLSATSGSIGCSATYGTTAAGSYKNLYWIWVTNGFSFSKTITMTATVTAGVQPCSLVVLDEYGAIKKSEDGNSPSIVSFTTKANAIYYIAIGDNDTLATVTLKYQ